MSYRVGLTGGIGSGKSTVASLFAEHGVPIVDTDVISHDLTRTGGAAIEAIQATFGDDFIDAGGALDRGKMRQLVFSDFNAKQRLENILHPLILAQARSMAESNTAPYILLVIPLLFESGAYQQWLQRTAVVDCTEETQLRRTMSRGDLDESTVKGIMAQQLTRPQRLLLADDIIDNDGDFSTLKPQIDKLHKDYLTLAERSN